MKPIKLKMSCETDISSHLIEFVSQNYGEESITPDLQHYFSDFNQNRNVISMNKDEQNTLKDLTTTLNITKKYLNQLVAIKSKMVFGPQPNSLNINFKWNDTITGNVWGSFNINFEYYNILFNIASLYFYLGYLKSSSPNIDKLLRKEAIKDYKYSLYLFNIIRDEAINKIEQRELPLDLYPAYCEYCIALCIAYGQIEIVKIAEETSPKELALRGKLLMGTAENFNKAYLLSNGEQAKMGGTDSYRNYLLNRYFYYKSLAFKKMAEIHLKKFDEKGLGYGEALIYQQQSIIALEESEKTLNFCEGLIDKDQFNILMTNEKKLESKMVDLNHRIYHQFTPDPNKINLETKILMTPLTIDNLYIKENETKFRDDRIIYCEDLDFLTPKEIRPMLENYKSQMNNFMQHYLSKFENDESIKKFIDKYNLPTKLTIKPLNKDDENSLGIRSELWEKINQIQQLGGGFYLSNSMKKLLKKSNDLIESLNLLLSDINKEENEDNYYRNKVGDQWVINPSSTLNMNYIQTIKNFLEKINQARENDIKEDNKLNENASFFDELSFTKNQMEQKLIQLGHANAELTPEEKKMREEIIKLYNLNDKLNNIISPILKEIKSGNGAIPYFSEVLLNKMTDKSVFEITKEKYLKQLQPLEAINNEIKAQMKIINDLIPTISDNSMFPMGDDSAPGQYFGKLEDLTNIFFEKVQKIKNMENFYSDFENKINNLIKTIKDWLEHRKEEKNMLLGTLKGNIARYDPTEVINPFDNKNVNINSNCFNENDKKNYYSPNPNFNQNINNNQIPNHIDNYDKYQNIFNESEKNQNNYNQNNNNNQNGNNYNNNFNQNKDYIQNGNNYNQNQINYKQNENNYNSGQNLNQNNFTQNQNNLNQNSNYQNNNQDNSYSFGNSGLDNNNYNQSQNNQNKNSNYQNNNQDNSYSFVNSGLNNNNYNQSQNNQNQNSNYQNNNQDSSYSFGNSGLNNNNYNKYQNNQNQNSNYQNNNQNSSYSFGNSGLINSNYNQSQNNQNQNSNYQNNNQDSSYSFGNSGLINNNYNKYQNNQNQNSNYQNNNQNSSYSFGNSELNNNNYNQSKKVNEENNGYTSYTSNNSIYDSNNNAHSGTFNQYDNSNTNFNKNNKNNSNNNNPTHPSAFNQESVFEDHFNPNKSSNINNLKPNSGFSFGQNNYNGDNYNNNTPYNF